MNNFKIFGLNLRKLPKYEQCFGSTNVKRVGKSWVKAEMSWAEIDGAGWRLKRAGWRWMALGGGGWSRVEVGARFSNTQLDKKWWRQTFWINCFLSMKRTLNFVNPSKKWKCQNYLLKLSVSSLNFFFCIYVRQVVDTRINGRTVK